jgi:hypothetical protein
MSVAPTSPPYMSRWSALAAVALGVLLLATLWVPITPVLSFTASNVYYHANLLNAFEPRALWGTVANVLGLSPLGYIVLIQVFHIAFAVLLVCGLAVPVRDGSPPLAAVAMGGFLFLFNTPVFLSNVMAGVVDIPTFTLTLGATLILFGRDRPLMAVRLNTAAGLMALAVLGHEKSIFDATILVAWLLWKQGWRRAAAYFTPVVVFYALFLLLNRNSKNAFNWTPTMYLEQLTQVWDYLTTNSLNIYGIFMGAGMLWVVLILVAIRFCRQGREAGSVELRNRAVLLVAIIGLCFAPLAVAWDTNRMVSLIWLPTFLLVRETEWLQALGREAKGLLLLVVLCGLHVFVPPSFAFKMGAVPVNCYAEGFLKEAFALWPSDPRHPSPLTLRIGLDRNLNKGNACWPPHLVR